MSAFLGLEEGAAAAAGAGAGAGAHLGGARSYQRDDSGRAGFLERAFGVRVADDCLNFSAIGYLHLRAGRVTPGGWEPADLPPGTELTVEAESVFLCADRHAAGILAGAAEVVDCPPLPAGTPVPAPSSHAAEVLDAAGA